MPSPQWRLLLGAALISFSPVFVALVSVSPTTSGFYRVAIGGLALLLWLTFSRRWRMPPRRVLIWLLLAAVAFTLDLWFWHKSILFIGPGLSTLLANFQVFILTAVGFFLLGQKPAARQLLAIPLAVVGLAMIVGLDWSSLSADYRWGIIFGLLTAASYAAYMMSFRQAQATGVAQSAGRLPASELAIVSLATALLLALTAQAEGASLAIPSVSDAAWLAAYGLIAHVLGWLLIASSLAQVPTALVGLSLLLQPLLSFVWDILFFGRQIAPLELAGASLALIAIYIGSRAPTPRRAVG